MKPIEIFDEDRLIDSPTIQKLSALARISPINTSDQVEVEAALAESLIALTEALDNSTIQFQDRTIEGAFWNLMMQIHVILTQPRPESSTQH